MQEEVKSAKFVISNTDVKKCPTDGLPEYAFIGRSNVGKSSLINTLTQVNGLAKTSSTPGKTLCINHFLVNEEWYIVDLPGYGYAKCSKDAREKIRKIIEGYILNRQAMTLLFVLVDSRHSPQKIDTEFMAWLGENGVPFSIIFTKADKLGKTKLDANINSYRRKLLEEWEELPPMFVTSSENKAGRAELLKYIFDINKSIKTEK
ncbi:MAG: YihA family ribosome biogenesis GTP-binding protein [Bacteroidales bacterium]|nr:YihA family ribosome biogenesis GTP-binding protein [Bacteroidaceae bacterium]MBR3608958.1 YihA family ribosome biogenesis GTP-binding protein [Bacteroidales bacterium]